MARSSVPKKGHRWGPSLRQQKGDKRVGSRSTPKLPTAQISGGVLSHPKLAEYHLQVLKLEPPRVSNRFVIVKIQCIHLHPSHECLQTLREIHNIDGPSCKMGTSPQLSLGITHHASQFGMVSSLLSRDALQARSRSSFLAKGKER